MKLLQALLIAAMMLAQDPKPAAKTVEDRLKELDEKIAALEKKHKTLADENAVMEKRIADGKAMREQIARQQGAAWIKRYAAAIELSEKQSSEIEQAWYAWSKEDLEKPYDAARWTAREDALKAKLTADQIPKLARKVREDQELTLKSYVAMFFRSAKLSTEKAAAAEQLIMGKITVEEGMLLPQAHPQKSANSWGQVLVAAESSLPELTSTLSEEELQALRKVLEQWKPRNR